MKFTTQQVTTAVLSGVIVLLIVLVIVLILFPQSTTATSSTSPYPGYELIWSDEFTGSTINTDYWNVVTELDGGGNYESEAYTSKGVSIAPGGGLNLTAEAIVTAGSTVAQAAAQLAPYVAFDLGAPSPEEPYMSQRYYTSGKVTTQGKVSFQYGRVDISCKIPAGQYLWPAVWCLPQLQTGLTSATLWPNFYELDLFECQGKNWVQNGGNTIGQSSLNFGDSYANKHYISTSYPLPNGGSFSDDFHVFSMLWTPNQVQYLLDDVVVCTYNAESLINCGDGTNCQCSSGACPWLYGTQTAAQLQADPTLQNPFYIILNLAVGGNLGGLNSPPLNQHYDNGVPFDQLDNTASDYVNFVPQVMQVKYVRIYQPIGETVARISQPVA